MLLEGVPVEIRLPTGLVAPAEPPPGPSADPDHPSRRPAVRKEVGTFTPGTLDSLKIVYDEAGPTSIFVHVRVRATAGGEYAIETAVPVSFEACRLSGLPAKAVHDFRLIPSPGIALDLIEWLRHPLTPWWQAGTGPYDGLFAFRSLELDTRADPIRKTLEWLKTTNTDGPPTGSDVSATKTASQDPGTELVLADAVVPWFSPWMVPVPRHVTAGLRRRLRAVTDPHAAFDFANAPVNIRITRDPAINFIVNSFFYRSQPFDQAAVNFGLTFSAAVTVGLNTSDPAAFGIGIGENYTVRTSYRRQFLGAHTPAPPEGKFLSLHRVLHFEILGAATIDLIGHQIGYSLGKAIGERADFKDCVEATVNLWLAGKAGGGGGGGGGGDSIVTLRGVGGGEPGIAFEGLGWRQGSFHFEGLSSPDGLVIMIANLVGIVIEELAIAAEQGASYFSISAGLLIKLPNGFEGGAGVRRLRFRIAGNPSAPSWKLDGFWVLAKGPTFQLEAGGFYKDEMVADTRVREFGFTGTFGLKLDATWVFGLDLLAGRRDSPADSFDYFMLATFFRGSIKFGVYFELRGARVLFSANMRPKLDAVDASSRDLRYFKWYRDSNPLDVPGSRRLEAWQAEKGGWSVGIGSSGSIPPIGALVEFSNFILGLGSPTEGGVLVVLEIRVLSSPNPVGYGAFELDIRHSRFSMLAGVELKLDTFIKRLPEWLSKFAKLTGTNYVSNDPPTFAIGRLADPRTWLALSAEFDLKAVSNHIRFALCLEIVGNGGPKGFGTLARLEGGFETGLVGVGYAIGISFVVEFFTTGSIDYALVLSLDAALRLTVFTFLTFGISADLEFHVVGAHPTRRELHAEIRLETPWFLPHVSCTFQEAFGEIAPGQLATSVQPLRSSSANGAADRKSLPVHIERAVADAWDGTGQAPLRSIAELQAAPATEADRLVSFAADAEAGPVATDVTIPIEFTVSVNDKLGLGSGTAPGLGNQRSGDLTLTYDFVGIAVRRRPRFGASRQWSQVNQRVELAIDFSDPNGVKLMGSFSPQELTKFWDADVKVNGQIATKKLLINSKTPFDFATVNAESDEMIAATHPGWPCCDTDETVIGQWLTEHRVDYLDVPSGTHVEPPRPFSASRSLLRWLQPARARDALTEHAAVVERVRAGVVARATFDEDVAFVMLRVLAPRGNVRLTAVAFDARGAEVGRKVLPPGNGQYAIVLVPAQGPVRGLDLLGGVEGNVQSEALPLFAPGSPAFALHWASYISLDEYVAHLIREAGCASGTPAFNAAYSGRGKVAWLPNHEYEVEVTTRITGRHPSVGPEAADVKEYVYFKTKGHPGLNAVERVGAEVESYVVSAYAGGRGRLYCCEPIAIGFSDDYAPAIPLASRPAGTSAERTQLLRLQLTARPEVAIGPEPTSFTAVGDDWLTAHRSVVPPAADTAWRSTPSAAATQPLALRSSDAMVARLAGLTQRPGVTCGLDDPRNTTGSLLVAPPQGIPDPLVAGGELWPARTRLNAVVRPYASGHVERERFTPGDETAFQFTLDDGAGPAGDWSIESGDLVVAGSAVRRYAVFGDGDWDHVSIVVTARPDAPAFGVGVGIPAGSIPADGLFAVVEQAGGGRQIAVYRRSAGGAPAKVGDPVPLPEPADASSPISLAVTLYDDQLQAQVGDTRLRVDRAGQGVGRCCLVTAGPARFTSLSVHGLDIFTFPVPVSRFRSFEDHVHSFDGSVASLVPNALGAGTTTTTVPTLWSTTQTAIAGAMAPGADAGVRQALFDRWVQGLGLPLRVDLVSLSISTVRDAGGAAVALLLESPEPLDFTTETTPTLTRRVGVWKPASVRADLPGIGLSQGLRDLDGSLVDVPAPAAPPPLPLIVTAVNAHPEGMRVDLADMGGTLRRGQVVDVARTGAGGGAARIFSGTVGDSDGQCAAIVAKEVAIAGADGAQLALTRMLPSSGPDTIAVAIAGRPLQVGQWASTDSPVPVEVLQDRDGLRALLIPVAAGAASALADGDHHLSLALKRVRFETPAPPDSVNHYAAEAGVSFRV